MVKVKFQFKHTVISISIVALASALFYAGYALAQMRTQINHLAVEVSGVTLRLSEVEVGLARLEGCVESR